MKKKIIISCISFFLLIVAGMFLAHKYFSGTVKKEVVFDRKTESGRNNSAGNNAERPEETTPNETAIKENEAESEPAGQSSANKEKENKNGSAITNNLVGWGFEKASGRKIDTIILHTTYNALGGDPFDFKKILDIYKSYGVAPHYVIDRGGKIYRLVSDANIAYHAGVSEMPDGRTNVNIFSIGIEIIGNKTEKLTDKQYAALEKLIAEIKSRHKIKNILGHSDIAPGRKDDPWNFDWKDIRQ